MQAVPFSPRKARHCFHALLVATFLENLLPEFNNNHGFFTLLAVFLAAKTGMLAGAGLDNFNGVSRR